MRVGRDVEAVVDEVVEDGSEISSRDGNPNEIAQLFFGAALEENTLPVGSPNESTVRALNSCGGCGIRHRADFEGIPITEIRDFVAARRERKLADVVVKSGESFLRPVEKIETDEFDGAGKSFIALDGHGGIARRVPHDCREEVPFENHTAGADRGMNEADVVEKF